MNLYIDFYLIFFWYYLVIGVVLVVLVVIFGVFGVYGFKQVLLLESLIIFEIGVCYQMYYGLVIFVLFVLIIYLYS